ncbi:MAG: hypothetical protein KIT83_22450 [Bryobacterales bacterium]|nr:hypothetical protein [Bryobacterales bacterium]
MLKKTSLNPIPRRSLLGGAAAVAATVAIAPGAFSQETSMHPFTELLQASQADKKGLVFYVGGQTVAGVVMKITGDDVVEVRNQTHSRIVIRLDRVDAVAMN